MQLSRMLPMAFALSLAAPLSSAGTVEVRFADPERYSDVGATRAEQVQNLEELARHLERLAQGLPADQVLRVDVLDIDLAGTQVGLSPRIVRNAADIPRLHVRYSISAGGQVLGNGEDHLTRLDYARTMRSARSSTALYDEKRLLDEWFAQRITAPAHAGR